MFTLSSADETVAYRHLEDLIALLADSVAGGASIGFLHTSAREEFEHSWKNVFAELSTGVLILIIALNEQGRVVGSAQLALSHKANGRHRAEVQKVLVHSDCRGKGLGRKLMTVIEDVARANQITLLVLDTLVGSVAEQMYAKLGYQKAGEIPSYAAAPDGVLYPTALFYKLLES
ncbi:MAG: N-acetyltransferase [Chloroflexi bacterium AL-W]|nr:N-acetyltransferase [Chloroflexi bacterium AL-N1]NOK66939.1 N-acetyltransferase [Chloroflexi bacterium AL-N10]NOK74769.1 N-acetyltransferase [Chloroflexi bacterium AL-N5]NOK81541.1 N-acetyltransferase [Chloroflexi bacterium AL-W]NOK89011.1 N-acetyltransferase [Chloroflexi bacterium AL-N15]